MNAMNTNRRQDSDSPQRISPMILTPDDGLPLLFVRRYLLLITRYAGVGIIGTICHYFLLFFLIAAMNPVAASTIGAVAGCIVNFYLARCYVFDDRNHTPFAFPKFAAVAAGGVGINALVMYLLTPVLTVIVSQLIATATVLITGFVSNNIWSFREYRT